MPLYYKLPLKTEYLTKRGIHSTCPLGESIAQHIHLLISTGTNEFKYDPSYGLQIWMQDFSLITNHNEWREETAESIKEQLQFHENRISNLKVYVDIEQVEITKPAPHIKQKMCIKVKAKIKKTNEEFNFYEELLFSPLSIS